MGLSRCEQCGTIEGEWRTVQVTEDMAAGCALAPGETLEVCCECGNAECRQDIPDHDDSDMER